PIVNALVFAPNTRLDSNIRERYVRSGLAHLLSISGLHVGFIAAWLALILGKLRLAARARFGATALLLLGYLWLLGFPAPAVRAGAMLVLADVARLRERVVAPRGVVALAGLGVLVQDAWALHSVGSWLSVRRAGRRPRAGRSCGDGGGVEGSAGVGGGDGRRVVAVEFAAPPVAHRGAGRLVCHGSRRDDVP